MSDGKPALDLSEETTKIRDVLGNIWAKLNHPSEADAAVLAEQIDAIGPQAEPEAGEPTDDELAAELARRQGAAPVKPIAEMTDEELSAEVARRQGAGA